MKVFSRMVPHAWMVLVVLIMWHVRPVFAWQSESACPHATIRLVNDYRIDTIPPSKPWMIGGAGWGDAVYQLGNLATYNALGDAKYHDFALQWATRNRWEIESLRVLDTAVRASAAHDGNVPANARDNNLATRWSAHGDGQWIEFDLGKELLIGVVAIAWFDGDRRQALFDLEVSRDRTNWTRVYQGQSSGVSTAQEFFDFPDVKARYIRYVGHGTSKDLWNSLTEVDIYYAHLYADHLTCGQVYLELFDLDSTNIPTIVTTRASADDGNKPANTIDNKRTTYWSAYGNGQWITFDIGAKKVLQHVSIGWFGGGLRRALFDLEVSNNQLNWTKVFSGTSSGTTTAQEVFNMPDVAARYVRYVGHGNSNNLWNSLTEVDIHPQSHPWLASIKGSVDIQLYRPAVDDWFWVDAMFMEAPVLSKLCALFQDTSYCAKLYAMYNDTKTRRGLYDAVIGLWYRDAKFINPKIFWSRGNGWVMAALVRVLEYLPAGDPHRNEYITTLQNMATALKARQILTDRTETAEVNEVGFWNANLDPNDKTYGAETSGTAFFTYAMAWGINQGHLNRDTYTPVVLKAWDGMVREAVHPNGKVGYVQGVGNDPSDSQPVTYESMSWFGVGALLLAGSEVAKLQDVTFLSLCQ